MDHDYRNQAYEARGSDSLASPSFMRERDSERSVSYEPRLSQGGRGPFRSGYSEPKERVFEDSIEDRYANLYRDRFLSDDRNENGSSWKQLYEAERLERLRESHFNRLALLYQNDPSAGFQGRGMHAYDSGNRGRRIASARGQLRARGQQRARGQPQTRGQLRTRGQLQTRGQPYARGQQQTRGRGRGRGGFVNTRGGKRKIGQTPASPGMPMKKRKQTTPGASPAAKKNRTANDDEVKNEQKRRRRDKNIEKNGTNEWKPYLCTLCKFRSYDHKAIEEHFESDSHKEMLDYIQKQGVLEKAVVEFLHENLVNKYRKIASFKTQSGVVKGLSEPNLLDDAAPDDHMVKSDTVHCSACDVYIPALHFSVQLHLKSVGHISNKETLKEQIKKNSVLTAQRMMRNPGIKSRCEQYLKGENPFEEKETEADDQVPQEEKEIKEAGVEKMQEA
ncbi:DBIRD complex subunit ZNF326 isoform X2 [Bombina bombina]|uniref:DBIRD complex subunit ZNF326 isoform X2 n=1 Tax=Bombina bombina TaxID=8345 RepID=UPI00235B1B18|nr:DBIRD complex subunit ZNF326 isoform X2 [Bombina bombina]